MDFREALTLVLGLAQNNVLTPKDTDGDETLEALADKQQDAIDMVCDLLSVISKNSG